MRRLGPLVLLLACALVAARPPALAEEAPTTIDWRGGPPDRLIAAADRENRPLFVALATLADGAGNEALATRLRDPAVVEISRSIVGVVASRHRHGAGKFTGTGTGTACPRFGGTCADHQAVNGWVLGRFGTAVGSLTTPRHLIVNPDGSVFAKIPYGAPAATLRRELERALAAIAPQEALRRAPELRRDAIAALRDGTTDATAYAGSDDPFRAAVLTHLWRTDVANRARWSDALSRLPATAFASVRVALLDDATLLGVATSIDAKRGGWWERFLRAEARAATPPPHDPALAAAFAKLQKGDASELAPLLDALRHPVDGPEVRAALTGLVGRDLGENPDAWRKELAR